MNRIVRIFVCFFILLLTIPVFAADPVPMRLISDQTARVAPSDEAPVCAKLAKDSTFSVGFVAESWYGISSPETHGKLCWLPAKSMEQVRTRSAVLAVPILIEAGRAVVTFLRDLFTGDMFKKKASIKIDPGTMVSILEEAADKVKIRTDGGQEGWIAREALSKIKEFSTTPKTDQGAWEGHQIVQTSGNLMVEVWVLKADGSSVQNRTELRLGDEYEIHARCSKDCYLRITCETPAAGAVCQYGPNHLPGFTVSPRIPAGQDAWPYIVPQGVRYHVSEPVMNEDILRIEAISAEYGTPFYYVAGTDKGEGCASASIVKAKNEDGVQQGCATRGGGFSRQGCGYRGGGFSVSQEGQTNPIPEVVSLFIIKTVH